MKEAKRGNRVYIQQKSLYFSALHKLIFQLPEEGEGLGGYFLEIVKALHIHLLEENAGGKLMLEVLVVVYQAIEQISQTIEDVEKTNKTGHWQCHLFQADVPTPGATFSVI